MKNPAIGTTHCGLVRECSNNGCVIRQIFLGLKVNPSSDLDKKKNTDIQRAFGKGFYPELISVGRGDGIDLLCPDFKEKR